MATRQIAQGLAGLGRYGDSMLMHVSPDEVAGLQSLGSKHGISLTTNPHTGLPEAFSFGNFLKAIAPTVAGVVAAPFTAGTSLAALGPIMAGAATGAGIAAASGENVLSGGLMGGLGGFGGGNLASGIQGMGAGAGSSTAGTGTATLNSAPGVAAETVASATPDVAAAVSPEIANQTAANVAQFGAMDGGLATQPTFGGMAQGVSNIGQEGSWDAFKAGLGPNTTDMQAATSVGLPLGTGLLAGAVPTMEEPKDEYDPNKSLNLSGDTGLRLGAGDSGLRLLAMGGSTNLYGSPDGTPAQNTINENYGLGRLNDLSAASARENAQMGGFAKGGLADGGFVVPADVVSHLGNGSTDAGLQHLQNRMGARPIRGAGDGMSDSIKTTIEGRQPARIANGEAYIPPEVVKQRGGAKNLYAMMDKVRKERTGTKKQGKQINPNKYLPA
jgi:hypothetical protein